MDSEKFLHRFPVKHNLDLKRTVKKTDLRAPILCSGCNKVYEIDLYGVVVTNPQGDEAIHEIVSPTSQHPFLCKECRQGEPK